MAISTLTGDNGVLTKATQAKSKTEKAEVLENLKLAVLASKISGNGTEVDLVDLEAELGKLGITSIEKQGEDGNLPWKITHKGYIFQITEDGEVQEINGIFLDSTELKLQEGDEKQIVATLTKELEGSTIEWSMAPANEKITVENGLVKILEGATGTVKIIATVKGTEYKAECTVTVKGDAIEELVSGKVYYADLNGDNEPDGVIYADLTAGNKGSGKWSDDDGFYTIPNNLTNPKEYSVIVENYNGPLAKFGVGDILAVSGNETGNDRFYIMALSDFTTNGPTYDWYNAAYGKLDNYGDDQKAFGTGKANTARMIAAWNARNALW